MVGHLNMSKVHQTFGESLQCKKETLFSFFLQTARNGFREKPCRNMKEFFFKEDVLIFLLSNEIQEEITSIKQHQEEQIMSSQ